MCFFQSESLRVTKKSRESEDLDKKVKKCLTYRMMACKTRNNQRTKSGGHFNDDSQFDEKIHGKHAGSVSSEKRGKKQRRVSSKCLARGQSKTSRDTIECFD